MSERIRSMQLGVDKVLALEARVSELEEQNAKLRRFVRAADVIREPMFLGDDWMVKKRWNEAMDEYDAARAEVDKEES